MKRSTALFLVSLSIGMTAGISGSLPGRQDDRQEGRPEVFIAYKFLGPHSRRSEITLDGNRLFKLSNEGDGDASACHARLLTDADINALVKRDGLFRMRPTADDSDFSCEGSRSLFMKVDARSIRLHEACKPKKDKADSAIDRAMDSLSNYLSGLVERDNEKCPDGS